MKTVYELSENELEELRETYFHQLLDTDPEVLGEITDAKEIAFEAIENHYSEVGFVEEDFFCNL